MSVLLPFPVLCIYLSGQDTAAVLHPNPYTWLNNIDLRFHQNYPNPSDAPKETPAVCAVLPPVWEYSRIHHTFALIFHHLRTINPDTYSKWIFYIHLYLYQNHICWSFQLHSVNRFEYSECILPYYHLFSCNILFLHKANISRLWNLSLYCRNSPCIQMYVCWKYWYT